MKRLVALGLTIAFAGACMNVGDARGGRGGGGFRGGGARMGGARPSSGMSRPSTPSSGFNFNNDISSASRPSQLPAGGANRPGNIERPPGGFERPPGTGTRPPGTARPPVPPANPVAPGWGWNGGVAWYPAPVYWGGGFWGAYGWGLGTAIVYGEYVDEETHENVTSYEVAPDSPGAKVLAAYQLKQTPCGAPNLVIIRGPNNSVVCAQPNNTVAAGQYDLDVTNLTISSAS